MMSRRKYPITVLPLGHPMLPLARRDRTVPVHRLLLWERMGGQSKPCHWCGLMLVWRTGNGGADSLVSDHIDGDTLNNEPANLVPSCRGCNGNRVQPRRASRPCEFCGLTFIKPRPEARFCSISCSSYQLWVDGKGWASRPTVDRYQ